MQEQVELDNGKYKWILHDNYTSEVLRYGEKWRDTTGDNLINAAMAEIIKLRGEEK